MAATGNEFTHALGPKRGLGMRDQLARELAEAPVAELLMHARNPDLRLQEMAVTALRNTLCAEQQEFPGALSEIERRSVWLALDSAQLSGRSRGLVLEGLTGRLSQIRGVDGALDISCAFTHFLNLRPELETEAERRLGREALSALKTIRSFGEDERAARYFNPAALRELVGFLSVPERVCDSYLQLLFELGHTGQGWRREMAHHVSELGVIPGDRRVLCAWVLSIASGDRGDDQFCEQLVAAYPDISDAPDLKAAVGHWISRLDRSTRVGPAAFKAIAAIWDNSGDGYEPMRAALRKTMASPDTYYQCAEAFTGHEDALTSLGREIMHAAPEVTPGSDAYAARSMLTRQFPLLSGAERSDPGFVAKVSEYGGCLSRALPSAATETLSTYFAEIVRHEDLERAHTQLRDQIGAFNEAAQTLATRFGELYVELSLAGTIGEAFTRQVIEAFRDLLAQTLADGLMVELAGNVLPSHRGELSERDVCELFGDRDFLAAVIDASLADITHGQLNPGVPERALQSMTSAAVFNRASRALGAEHERRRTLRIACPEAVPANQTDDAALSAAPASGFAAWRTRWRS